MEKIEYSFWIGLKKSIKNTIVVGVLPALAFLVANYTEWLSPDLATKLAPLFGVIGYLVKNYYQIKK